MDLHLKTSFILSKKLRGIYLIIIFLLAGSFFQSAVFQISGKIEITANTDKSTGTCYRFWNVHVTTNQNEFLKSSPEFFKSIHPFMESVNCVRILGGRNDSLNLWYKGVDDNGDILVDFTDLIGSLKAIINMGYKPRIVLDNVPAEMSDGEMNFYGNCKPPKDYDIWRKYITAFINTLINEFGIEQVKTWRFRVGTEPDLFPNHWNGTREEYLKHYDITVDAVTKIIPDVEIGPGNILNPTKKFKLKYITEPFDKETADLIGTGQGWGLSIIDHVASGKNHVTGKTGTKMDFFAISYYDGVGRNKPILLDESIRLARERLNRYPETRKIPLSIQEFGILQDENNVRLWGNDITEWGASWYAVTSDIVYKNNIEEVYEWSTTTLGIPHPRTQVIRMLEMMSGGERIDVTKSGNPNGYAGAIACVKEGKVYILLYSHQINRIPVVGNTISLKLGGIKIAKTRQWFMNEWTVDKNHAVWVYEMYDDLAKAGIKPDPGAPVYDGSLNRTFSGNWKKVFDENRARYEKMAEFPLTAEKKKVKIKKNIIQLNYDMPGNSVKLIELTPGK